MNVAQASTRKPITRFALVVAVAVAASTATPARADYRCDAPRSRLDQQVCAIAKQGPNELRRFIQRTQPIYHLSFYDYADDRDFARRQAEGRVQPSQAFHAAAPAEPVQDAGR